MENNIPSVPAQEITPPMAPAPLTTISYHNPSADATSGNASSFLDKRLIIIICIMMLLGLVFPVGYYVLSKNPSLLSFKNNIAAVAVNLAPVKPTPTATPFDTLNSAITKTINAKTLYLAYTSAIDTHIAMAKTGTTQTLRSHIDGNIAGSTDGKTVSMDMKIYSDMTPDSSVNLSMMDPGDGNVYLKTAKTGANWQKMTQAQYSQSDGSPTDASLYLLDMAGSIFSQSQALLKSFTPSSITSLPDESTNGISYYKYQVDENSQSFISVLSQDKATSQKLALDSRTILQNAIITVTFYVDKSSGYVSKITLNVKGLTQIPVQAAQTLGLSSTHDVNMDMVLSRFGVPTDITPPVATQVLGASTSIYEKPTLPLNVNK